MQSQPDSLYLTKSMRLKKRKATIRESSRAAGFQERTQTQNGISKQKVTPPSSKRIIEWVKQTRALDSRVFALNWCLMRVRHPYLSDSAKPGLGS
jgi:hypothetical protein